MVTRLLLALALLLAGLPVRAQTPASADPVTQLTERLRALALEGNAAALGALSATPGGASVDEFVRAMTPAPAELVIKERDRSPLPGGGQRVLLEIFAARGIESRVFTWQMDLTTGRGAESSDPANWRIVRLVRLSIVTGLYRLSLDLTEQYDVRDLTFQAPDLTLRMASGSAFLATTPEGPTAIVLVGRGQLQFAPPVPAERTQVRIFSGQERLTGDFDALFLRIRPSDFSARFVTGTMTPRPVVPSQARRAASYFDDYVGRSLTIDLNDLSRDRWSLLPQPGDVVAEIKTRKYGNLTYARALSDAEDISVFDRRKRKNIAVYASVEKLATRGPSYSEDDYVDYDIQSYDLEVDFSPDRPWLDGRARLALTTLAAVSSSITLRIADTLAVRSVYSPELGRLMHLRVVGQNAVIVNFPVPVPGGTRLNLQVVYGGLMQPQELDREAAWLEQDRDPILLQPETRYIYSNRSYWYPQGTVGDYATARMRLTVPEEYDVVASGMPAGPPGPAPALGASDRPRKMFAFTADQPLRYLACVISRFTVVATADLAVPAGEGYGSADGPDRGPLAGAAAATLSLVVQANPRQTSRGRDTAESAAAIIRFYSSIVGDAPYPSFTVALSESERPGGHSPAYFAILNQTLPTAPFVWRNDPVSFDRYPTFFLAHEIAHQWWGQAVGWKNYHEQWLSEGIAQYFAALFSAEERGDDTFVDVLKQMRRWAIESSPQGPVYLGYRLGHIKGDSRIFRAVVYNKAAMVLHMLRGLLGEGAFVRGLRAFYGESRFRKAGTIEFRDAMERASGQDLKAFFEAWIYGTDIPRLSVRHVVDGNVATVTIEQQDAVIPVPVTITLEYQGRNTESVVVPVTERIVTKALPLTGPLRKLEVNEEQSLAVFGR